MESPSFFPFLKRQHRPNAEPCIIRLKELSAVEHINNPVYVISVTISHSE